MDSMDELLAAIRACRLCEEHLPEGPRPVVHCHRDARILVVGQAPGRRVHQTGIAFNDPSGDRLRMWMGVTREQFYDARQVALIPMGFCYPGTGDGGDMPPRPECAAAWRAPLLAQLPRIELTLLLGQYALRHHMASSPRKSVTDMVAAWRETWSDGVVPMPHPSPRNQRWFRKHPWFEEELVPALRKRVGELLV